MCHPDNSGNTKIYLEQILEYFINAEGAENAKKIIDCYDKRGKSEKVLAALTYQKFRISIVIIYNNRKHQDLILGLFADLSFI